MAHNDGSLAFQVVENLPGKPVAYYSSGLVWLIYGLLWGIVAHCFGLVGVPGRTIPWTLFLGIRPRVWEGCLQGIARNSSAGFGLYNCSYQITSLKGI